MLEQAAEDLGISRMPGERGFERVVRQPHGQRVAVALLIEKIGVSELDAEVFRAGGGEVPIEFDGRRAIALRHAGRDRALDERQGGGIG